MAKSLLALGISAEIASAAMTLYDSVQQAQNLKQDLKVANALLEQSVELERDLLRSRESSLRMQLVQHLSRQDALFGAGNIGGGRSPNLLERSARIGAEWQISIERLRSVDSIGRLRVQQAVNRRNVERGIRTIAINTAVSLIEDIASIAQMGVAANAPGNLPKPASNPSLNITPAGVEDSLAVEDFIGDLEQDF